MTDFPSYSLPYFPSSFITIKCRRLRSTLSSSVKTGENLTLFGTTQAFYPIFYKVLSVVSIIHLIVVS